MIEDYPRLLHALGIGPGLGARLDLRALPLSVAARQANDGRPAIEHALYDGEDYELLFALAPQDLPAFSQAWSAAFPGTSCTPIGVCLPPPPRLCATGPEGEVELAPLGYEHF
jgi:thiamine-monophosphate kinase